MSRLYANENMPLPTAEELRRLGHNVLTVQEAGQGDQARPDHEVLAFATAESRTVVTLNRRDFIWLHGEQPAHAGIIVCTFDPDFERLAHAIHGQIEAAGELTGRLIRVQRPLH